MDLLVDGNERRDLLNDPGPIAIERRLDVVYMGNRWSTYGPTPTHIRSFEIAKAALAELKTALDQLVGSDLPALEKQLDAAGVPWSVGRK